MHDVRKYFLGPENNIQEYPVNEADLQELYDAHERRLRAVPMAFRRSLHDRIDWNDRLVCIKGPRGVGKTTLMLQRIKEAFPDPSKALCVSLDNLWFATHRLQDVAAHLDTHGATHLFLDEVHHHPDWQTLVKNLHDDFPALSIVYSSSSLLQLEAGAGDLSRRQLPYALPGLSFREFLAFEGVLTHPPVSLSELLASHADLARGIASRIKVLPFFERYLRSGHYPFYRESPAGYPERLRRIVAQVLDVDYPRAVPVSLATVRKARKMLMVLASSTPQIPRMTDLWRELETDRNNGLAILHALARAGLVALLPSRSATLKNLSRPEKIYLGDTNLMHALVPRPDPGTIRETFFLNQLSAAGHDVSYPPRGDFLVDARWLFEVGGPSKTFRQIADAPDSYLALDGLETGRGNRIPLWLFGFLY